MLTTKNQAIQFLTTMQHLHPLVHPEDDLTQMNPAFSDDQVKYLTERFDECYKLLDDPCGIILGEIRPTMTMFNSKLN
jgi:hypothetical protein